MNNPALGKFRLVTYAMASGESKTLVAGNMAQAMYDPAWSPDGKTIVCVMYALGDAISALVAIDVATGKQNRFFDAKDGPLFTPVWLPDGQGLLARYVGRETNFSRNEIVAISYRDHTSRAITHDINDYVDLSLSADGRMAATVLNQAHYDLFVTPVSELSSGQAQLIPSGARVYTFAWTPDGKMIVGQDALNLLQPETGNRTPLTSNQQDGVAVEPDACANGRYVVAAIGAHGGAKTLRIFRMDAGGGSLKQLSDGSRDESPVCSQDGKWVYYTDLPDGAKLHRVSLEGGKPEKLSELPAYRFDISPDGKLAAFPTFGAGNPKMQLALLTVDSPQNPKIVEMQRRIPTGRSIRFTRDGKAVVYPFREGEAENLWLQPLDGSPGKQLTNFKTEQITDFRWSFDGSKMGMLRGHTDSDVVLLEETKP